MSKASRIQDRSLSFWWWLVKGSGGHSGLWRLFLNRWVILHLVIGVGLAFLVPVCLRQAASIVLIPLIGILIGLSFAWAGNAQALMQSSEIKELTKHHKGGFTEYVFIYQTAILVILVTLVVWALAGLSVFDDVWPTQGRRIWYFVVEAVIYALSSMTLRECWQVVLGTQVMLIVQTKIKEAKEKQRGKAK